MSSTYSIYGVNKCVNDNDPQGFTQHIYVFTTHCPKDGIEALKILSAGVSFTNKIGHIEIYKDNQLIVMYSRSEMGLEKSL